MAIGKRLAASDPQNPAVATASNKAAAAAKTVAGPTGLFHHAAASSMAVKDHQHEIEAMIKAIEGERKRVAGEWESISQAKTKLMHKRQSLHEDKKLIDEALRKLASIDRSLEKRLSKVDQLVEDSNRIRGECRLMTEDCHAIESGRGKAISEAKVEAVQRLEAVEREAQRLETIREAANKERRRLLHTRTASLCTRCQKPLLDDTKIELSNLGLRTAGDGETLSSGMGSLHQYQFASLRKDAQRDQEYLAREAHYLQSIATIVPLLILEIQIFATEKK